MSNNPLIHPTAIIDSSAVIASDVTIGPYCIIGPNVTIGEGTKTSFACGDWGVYPYWSAQ